MAKRNNQIREQARNFRLNGVSYDKISKKLGINKSTLHYWFLDLPPSRYQIDPNYQHQHLAKVRMLASKAIRAKKEARIEAIRQKVLDDIKNFSFNDLKVQKAILSVLYWAEGSKTSTSAFKFANTDPALSRLFLTLLRNTCKIDETKIRVKLYLHYYHKIKETRGFWSRLLEVPGLQFERVYIKSRKKTKRKRRNFMGICFIKYGRGSEHLKQELLITARTLQQKITKPCAHSSIG